MIAKLTSRVFFNASPSQLSNASRLRAKFPSSARGGPVILCPPSEPNTAYPRASGDVAPSVVARCPVTSGMNPSNPPPPRRRARLFHEMGRSEEHTSELQSLMRISYAVFCLKKKTTRTKHIKSQSDTTKKCKLSRDDSNK